MGKRNAFKDFNSAFDSEWLWKNRESSLGSRLFKHTKYYDKVCEDARSALSDIPSGGNIYENDLFILLYSGRNDISSSADWLYRKMAEEIRKSKGFLNLKSLCESKEVVSSKCYLCHRNLRKRIKWFSANGRHYYCVAYCEKHGYLKGKIRVRKAYDGGVYIVKTTKLISKEDADAIAARRDHAREVRKRHKHSKAGNGEE